MLSIGIVGLPNVGKSTLFKALTKKEVEIANYPFATIDPNVGVVEVPDERIKKLAKLSKSEKQIPTAIEFVDIAGLVKGANKGEGLGNQFLANIRSVDAILYVVRAFEDPDIQHVEDSVDVLRDIETLRAELALKDLDTLDKKISKVEGQANTGDKSAKIEYEATVHFRDLLNEGTHLIEYNATEKEQPVLEELQLLTSKPSIFLLNAHKKEDIPKDAEDWLEKKGFEFVNLNIVEELESAGLSKEEMEQIGLDDSKVQDLIRSAYTTLKLITFFTTGPEETRAWTIKKGAKAPDAAGVIHTDFKEKFIRAETIAWDKLVETGSWATAREKGLIRTEGKDYVVQDGDTMLFLHS